MIFRSTRIPVDGQKSHRDQGGPTNNQATGGDKLTQGHVLVKKRFANEDTFINIGSYYLVPQT